MMTSMIRVGTSGWKYKDWNRIVYPARKPRGFDELAYLARYFTTIEINSSYYGPPRPTTAKQWVQSISDNGSFQFTAKLFHTFTHERKPGSTDEKEFKDGIAPIAEAGRLGALLLQFPWSFRNIRENREYLAGLHRRFREYAVVLEVRHASWTEPEILDLLGELEIGICNIDQPLFKRSVEPAAETTTKVGYVRLHGRNYKSWFDKEATVRERYDYLYPVDQLEPWIARVKEIAAKAKDTYVLTNNHNFGKSAVNALQLISILNASLVPAPPTLIERYPELKGFADET